MSSESIEVNSQEEATGTRVEAIRLMNFMAFEDTGWIVLKHICLLFGRNSSGKSVISRALRLLKQSRDMSSHSESSKDKAICFFSEEGIDQGLYEDTVHKQEPHRRMAFHFRCTLPGFLLDKALVAVNRKRSINNHVPIPKDVPEKHVELRLAFESNTKGDGARLDGMEILCAWTAEEGLDKRTLFAAQRLDNYASSIFLEEWYFWSDFLEHPRTNSGVSPWSGIPIDNVSGFLPAFGRSKTTSQSISAYPEDIELVEKLMDAFDKCVGGFLDTIAYLGPIRPEPKRVYAFDPPRKLHWERSGLGAFLEFLDEKIDPDLAGCIDEWLQYLDLANEVIVGGVKHRERYSGEQAFVSKVAVFESPEGLEINLKDTGFGICQVLPILIQSSAAKQGSLVIIEQPGLHLHPGAQAELGDMFISMAKKRGVRFLLETHSENLLLRLRRRVAQTLGKVPGVAEFSLCNDDFKAYFVDRPPQQSTSTVEALEFNEWGDFKSRPARFGDFFGQDFEELVKMKKARFGRKNEKV